MTESKATRHEPLHQLSAGTYVAATKALAAIRRSRRGGRDRQGVVYGWGATHVALAAGGRMGEEGEKRRRWLMSDDDGDVSGTMLGV